MVPSSVGRPGLSMSGLSVMPAVADPITNLQVSTTWLLFLSTPYVKSWKIGTNKSCRPCTINRKYLISRRLCVLLLYKCKSKIWIKKLLQNLCSLMHQLPPLVAHFRSNLSARRTCLKARVQPSSTPNCSLIDASPILSFDILRHRLWIGQKMHTLIFTESLRVWEVYVGILWFHEVDHLPQTIQKGNHGEIESTIVQ